MDDPRSFVELREELAEALTVITIHSGIVYEDNLENERNVAISRYVFEASLVASAVFKLMFQGDAEKPYSIEQLRTAFSLGDLSEFPRHTNVASSGFD